MSSSKNRRYYLHRVIKKTKNVVVNPKNKTVYIPFDLELSPKITELRDTYNYSIQTEIQ